MRKIITDFIEGDTTKKLSIASDFATILGVSVATFVAGPFLSKFAEVAFIPSDFILAIAFYFLCVILAFGGTYDLIQYLYTNTKDKKYLNVATKLFFSLLMLWAVIVVFPYVKHFVGNTFNVSYLLPEPAIRAVKFVSEIQIEDLKSSKRVSGSIEFSVGANPSDYVAISYYEDVNGLFFVGRFGPTYNADYEGEINSKGDFKFPVVIPEDAKEIFYILIYRKSDWSLLKMFGGGPAYPHEVTQLPDTEIDKLGAYIAKVKLKKQTRH